MKGYAHAHSREMPMACSRDVIGLLVRCSAMHQTQCTKHVSSRESVASVLCRMSTKPAHDEFNWKGQALKLPFVENQLRDTGCPSVD